jgi:hypothetical protein
MMIVPPLSVGDKIAICVVLVVGTAALALQIASFVKVGAIGG